MNKLNEMNYVTALPDFMTMQRTSFCWFINQGLTDELRFFTNIFDFSENTEYVLYAQEFKILKSSCTISIARKYNGNYRVRLVLPLEVRNKKTNIVYYYSRFSIVALPLMTTVATFILNGCERVVVSQIIRSPGVYFEKLKNQKPQLPFKRKLSTDITKLRSFLPAGEASLSDKYLFFASPKLRYKEKTAELIIIPTWTQKHITLYSLDSLKKQRYHLTLSLLSTFKLYLQFIVFTISFEVFLSIIQ